MKNVMIFDIETSLDTEAVCRGFRLGPHDPILAREAVGQDFPKLPFHEVIAIGRLEAFLENGIWRVGQIACDHAGDMQEPEMICRFDERMVALRPTLIGFNIKPFDLPVLRYRAMMLGLAMPGVSSRKYFARYFDDAEDLCDWLANYDARGKVSLDLLSKVLGLPGKPEDVDGGKLEPLIATGDFEAIAVYCEQDVILTYLCWLRHRLYQGQLSRAAHSTSILYLDDYLRCKRPWFAHLCSRPIIP